MNDPLTTATSTNLIWYRALATEYGEPRTGAYTDWVGGCWSPPRTVKWRRKTALLEQALVARNGVPRCHQWHLLAVCRGPSQRRPCIRWQVLPDFCFHGWNSTYSKWHTDTIIQISILILNLWFILILVGWRVDKWEAGTPKVMDD